MWQHIVHCVGCLSVRFSLSVYPPLHTRHILHSARYAATSQSTNEVFLLTKLSVALVRNSVCSLKMIELSKHVGAN
jgi:hypothetical protein